MSQRLETPLKALLLIGLGLFLYSRLANGTLDFYINRRFFGFTLLAVIGLIVVGLSYRLGRRTGAEHDHALTHDHAHDPGHAHDSHEHSHGLTWGAVALVLLPMTLGIAVPPQPLGASALANREINAGLRQNNMPGIIGAASQKATTEMNIFDWWQIFRTSPDLNTDPNILNQEASVVGFVYQDKRYGEGHFLVTRYMVSCCVADASALGLVVAWPDAPKLENDQWVEVRGVFTRSSLDAWQMPILNAQAVTPVAIPDQPYLYP